MLYIKLAYTNIKKNSSVYLPFCLATVFTVILNVVMQVMLFNRGMDYLPQADSVKSMFGLGSIIIMIFTVLFTFYSHSFLLKRRKKELALYNILGMDKQNLTIMMLFENLLIMLFILLIGLISGIIFSKLLFLVFKRLTGFGEEFVYSLSLESIEQIVLLFIAIFLFTFLYDVWEVRKSNSIELLNQAKAGEKEPKSRWLLSFIGILFLGAGYFISLSIDSPVKALMLFFVAVIFVIIGTYSLFISGSITVLNYLKKRATIYYKPSNFISISGMLFRMKQNGAGLATICILCTMALVSISTTICLYAGSYEIVQDKNPFKQSVVSPLSSDQTQKIIEEVAQSKKVNVKNMTFMTNSKSIIVKENKPNEYSVSQENLENYGGIMLIKFLGVSEYNRIQKTDLSLKNNEVFIYPVSGSYQGKVIKVEEQVFDVKGLVDSFVFAPYQKEAILDELFLIVSDEYLTTTSFEKILLQADRDEEGETSHQLTTVNFDIVGNTKERLDMIEELRKTFGEVLVSQNVDVNQLTVTSIDEDWEELRVLLGGFLFMGIIFGISFLIATTLIIYYKQLSEGNDDHKRFDIMQKVGLSHKEVKQSINQQILFVFFLPIAVAVLHLIFAFPIIRKLLILFGLTNTKLLIITTIASVVVFTIGYFIIYWRTSKVYYYLVER